MVADYEYRTRNPDDPEGDPVAVIFPAYFTLRLYKYSPVRYYNLIAARDVLNDVKRIFWGIREFQEGGYCYSGRPQVWFVQEKVQVPFPNNLVFAVYMNPRMRIYECRAEEIAVDDELCPINWRDRFGGLKWKSTS